MIATISSSTARRIRRTQRRTRFTSWIERQGAEAPGSKGFDRCDFPGDLERWCSTCPLCGADEIASSKWRHAIADYFSAGGMSPMVLGPKPRNHQSLRKVRPTNGPELETS